MQTVGWAVWKKQRINLGTKFDRWLCHHLALCCLKRKHLNMCILIRAPYAALSPSLSCLLTHMTITKLLNPIPKKLVFFKMCSTISMMIVYDDTAHKLLGSMKLGRGCSDGGQQPEVKIGCRYKVTGPELTCTVW